MTLLGFKTERLFFMANRKGLKQKDVERLDSLIAKHPGDITPEEEVEKTKLTQRYEKYGRFDK